MRTTTRPNRFQRRIAQLRADRPLYLAAAALVGLLFVVLEAGIDPPTLETSRRHTSQTLGSRQFADPNAVSLRVAHDQLAQGGPRLTQGGPMAAWNYPTLPGSGPSRMGASRLR